MKIASFLLFSVWFAVAHSICEAQNQLGEPQLQTDTATVPLAKLAPDLKTAVTFEVKHLFLSDLLTQINQQTGLQLVLGAEWKDCRVTARVTSIPLDKVLAALENVYNFTWVKQSDTQYLATTRKLGVLENLLNRIGDDRQVQEKAAAERASQGIQWDEEIFNYTNLTDLQSKSGVPVSVLPEELLRKLRKDLEKAASMKLIQAHWQTLPSTLEKCSLIIQAPIQKVRTNRGTILRTPIAALRTPEGLPLTLLVPLSDVPHLGFEPPRETKADMP